MNFCGCSGSDINSRIITVKYFDKNMPELIKLAVGDWFDLRIRDIQPVSKFSNVFWDDENEVFKYTQNSSMLIYLGVGMILPEGHEAHVLPRGSTFKHTGLIQTNSMGIIDNSYCGEEDEWAMPAFSLTSGYVEKYQRIAQFRIMPTMEKMSGVLYFIEDDLYSKSRGGQGSTGKI